MLTRKLLFLPLILLFISCTVTKRVHRPGFHVQWRKIQRTHAPEETEKITKFSTPDKIEQHEKTASILQPEQQDCLGTEIATAALKETVAITHPKKRFDFKRIVSIPEIIDIKSLRASNAQRGKAASLQSSRPIFWRISAKNLKFIGILFMCLGGLLLLGSLLAYAGAFSGNGTGAWANFFVDLISISEWFWLLVFILVIVLLLYIAVTLVQHVFGGPLIGALVGLSFLAIGIFFYALGDHREIEP